MLSTADSVTGTAERPAAWLPTREHLSQGVPQSTTKEIVNHLSLALDRALIAAVKQRDKGEEEEEGDWEEVTDAAEVQQLAAQGVLNAQLISDGPHQETAEHEEDSDMSMAYVLQLLRLLVGVDFAHDFSTASTQFASTSEKGVPSVIFGGFDPSGAVLALVGACLLALHAPASHFSEGNKDHLAALLGGPPSTTAQQDTGSTLGSNHSVTALAGASQPPPVQGAMLQDCTLLLLTDPIANPQPSVVLHLGNTKATGSGANRSTTHVGSIAPGDAAGITLLGALVQALGGERVPHLAAVHAGWEAGGRQHLEQVRSGLTCSPSYQHYPAYLQWVAQQVQALNREVVARYMRGGPGGRGKGRGGHQR
jgi:hypothetical protein